MSKPIEQILGKMDALIADADKWTAEAASYDADKLARFKAALHAQHGVSDIEAITFSRHDWRVTYNAGRIQEAEGSSKDAACRDRQGQRSLWRA